MQITIHNLTKKYGKETLALDGVSLDLREGITAILGPNGSGKSTLMKILTFNLKQDAGTIELDGQEIAKMGAEYRSLIGYVPQTQSLYNDFTAREFLYYIGMLGNVDKNILQRRTRRLLGAVGLDTVADRRISSFSGGMKQRLLIAQALVTNPAILIMDEPSVGLDPKQRVRIRELIRQLGKERIILYSTHIVSDVESIADNVVFLKKGRVMQSGSLTAVCAPENTSGEGRIQTLEEVYLQHFGTDYDDDDTL